MEQKLKEIERENVQKEDRLLFMENENRELQSNVDQLSSQTVFSSQCICGKVSELRYTLRLISIARKFTSIATNACAVIIIFGQKRSREVYSK